MNPLYERFGSQPSQNQSMLQQFNQFASNFRGDPKTKVEELIRSGQMTKEQFNEYSQMATALRKMFGR